MRKKEAEFFIDNGLAEANSPINLRVVKRYWQNVPRIGFDVQKDSGTGNAVPVNRFA